MSDRSSLSSSEDLMDQAPPRLEVVPGFRITNTADLPTEASEPDSFRFEVMMSWLQAQVRTVVKNVIPIEDYMKSDPIRGEDDDYIYPQDELDDARCAEKDDEHTKQLIPVLQNVCWGITDSVRHVLQNHRMLKAENKLGVDMRRLIRIIQQISLIDDDLRELSCSSVPTFQDLSFIHSLTTLIQQVTAKKGQRVIGTQVKKEINVGRLLSHYQGFISYREEDLKSLDNYKCQIDVYIHNWDLVYPYFWDYTEHTDIFSRTEDQWTDVRMTESEMMVWNESMRELLKTAGTLLALSKAFLWQLDDTVRGYHSYQRSLKLNLFDFLNLEISELFVKKIEAVLSVQVV